MGTDAVVYSPLSLLATVYRFGRPPGGDAAQTGYAALVDPF